MIKLKKNPSWTKKYLMDVYWLGVILQLAKLKWMGKTPLDSKNYLVSNLMEMTKLEIVNIVGKIQFKFVGKLQIKFCIIFDKSI